MIIIPGKHPIIVPSFHTTIPHGANMPSKPISNTEAGIFIGLVVAFLAFIAFFTWKVTK